jgi:hypothetical protein
MRLRKIAAGWYQTRCGGANVVRSEDDQRLWKIETRTDKMAELLAPTGHTSGSAYRTKGDAVEMIRLAYAMQLRKELGHA